MKSLTIWQRLNLANLLLIVLLLISSLLVWWVTHARTAARQFEQQVAAATASLRVSLVQLSDGLRGQLLDPTSATERERVSAAETALPGLLDQVELLASGDTESLEAIRALREFSKGLLAHKTTVAGMTRTDPPAALTYYAQTYASLLNRQYELMSDLEDGLAVVVEARSEQAQDRTTIGLAGLGGILVLCVLVSLIISSSINKPLVQVNEHLDGMRKGDFSGQLKLERGDEFGTIAEGLNQLGGDLSALVGQVQRSGIKIKTTATEIATTAREQQSTTNEIAATTAEIGATSKKISTTSLELLETIAEVGEVAGDAAELAGTGQGAIARMEETMHQIMNASKAITSKLSILTEKTGNINSVVTTINKVADQTNLLSLNAAIEAEKAGEYGLGFAVVAIEIRRLADQTAVATYDIERMVKEMQSAVTAGVLGMDRFCEDVRRGVDQIREVGLHLAQIINQVQALNPRFQNVHEGMQSQATGAQQICETLVQLSEAAHQTAESLQQSNHVIEALHESSRGLQSSVARFKLERDGAG